MSGRPTAGSEAARPARILIVDDEPDNRFVVQLMLKPAGFVLQTAESGELALAMVAREAPDLILLDAMLVDMDGYQVAAKIKGARATQHIPIIMLTAMDETEARARAVTSGADDVLTKPVRRLELCLRVNHLLQSSRAAAR